VIIGAEVLGLACALGQARAKPAGAGTRRLDRQPYLQPPLESDPRGDLFSARLAQGRTLPRQSLLAGAEQGGAQLVWHSPVEHLSRNGHAWLVEGHCQGEAVSLTFRHWTQNAWSRPKLSGPGEPASNFVLQTERAHGLPSLTGLHGSDSPGLTASMTIAERLAAMLQPGVILPPISSH
jgi:hypothetical protein